MAIPVRVITPINVPYFASLAISCPHRTLSDYVLHGLRFGFDIGFRGLASASRPPNLRSARAIPAAVTTAVNLEITRGHTAGPFRDPPFPLLHCSPLGAAPKMMGQPGSSLIFLRLAVRPSTMALIKPTSQLNTLALTMG